MNGEDSDASEAKADDIPSDVKYEPLAIKDELSSTESCVYAEIRKKTYFAVKTEYSSGDHSEDDVEEPGIHLYTNYEYDGEHESNVLSGMEHSTATSDSQLIATTHFETRNCRMLDRQVHNCDICREHFLTAEDLIAHRYTHTDEANFTCLICRITFHIKQHLHAHILNTHSNLCLFKCRATMNEKDCDTNEAKTDDFAIDAKYEPLAIKDEFSAIESCVYADIRKKTYLKPVKTEYSVGAHSGGEAKEPDIRLYTNYEYDGEHEPKVFTGMEYSTATSDSQLIATTPSETRHCRLLDIQVYHCDICSQSFDTAEDLIAHRYTHTDDANFTCLICRKPFHMKQQLRRHILNTHSNLRPFQCDICYKLYKRKDHFRSHKRIHTGDKPYECYVCHKSFTLKGDLISHKRIHTGEKPYECDVCHKSFTQKGNLNLHKQIHTSEKPYECDVCRKSFTQKRVLISHKRIHTGEKPFECYICHKSYRRKDYLTSHKRIHTGEKLYECDVCHQTFTHKGALNLHKRIHTGEKPYKCDICHKLFKRTGELTRHNRIHIDEKLYECPKSFTQKGDLISHKRIHTGEKPYECDVCQKSFTQKGNLNLHKRIHTSEKPYECDVCQKSFTQKRNLNLHKQIHTGEKPFECYICHKSYGRKDYLTSHKRIHTDEKPYQCDICHKLFKRTGEFTMHKRIHIGEKLCECHKSFTQKGDLTSHKRIHAGEKSQRIT